MGTLISNGVPLVQTLTISRAIMTNRRMSDALEIVAQASSAARASRRRSRAAASFPCCSRI